jgi:Sec-independent protein translocase protein TatA
VISLFVIFGIVFLLLGFKKLVEVIDQANYERRRFHLMVAEELKRLDDLYKDKQSWGEVQYEEKKWWGRN